LIWDNVFRSEPILNSLDPVWQTAMLELSIVCSGERDLPIRINVFDHKRSGMHKAMGQAELRVNGMVQAASSGQPIKVMVKNKELGTLTITKTEVAGITSTGPADIASRIAATTISPPCIDLFQLVVSPYCFDRWPNGVRRGTRSEINDGPAIRLDSSWSANGTVLALSFWLVTATIHVGRRAIRARYWNGLLQRYLPIATVAVNRPNSASTPICHARSTCQ
jgi:hypothetical protein